MELQLSGKVPRVRDHVIPWIYFNLAIAVLPVALRLFSRFLHNRTPVDKVVYEEPDLLLVSFAVCATIGVELTEARSRGIVEERPNLFYFFLLLLGGAGFIAYLFFVYEKEARLVVAGPHVQAQKEVLYFAVYWAMASSLLSIGIKIYLVKRELKLWTQ